MCVCVCVCVWGEREGEREWITNAYFWIDR